MAPSLFSRRVAAQSSKVLLIGELIASEVAMRQVTPCARAGLSTAGVIRPAAAPAVLCRTRRRVNPDMLEMGCLVGILYIFHPPFELVLNFSL